MPIIIAGTLLVESSPIPIMSTNAHSIIHTVSFTAINRFFISFTYSFPLCKHILDTEYVSVAIDICVDAVVATGEL